MSTEKEKTKTHKLSLKGTLTPPLSNERLQAKKCNNWRERKNKIGSSKLVAEFVRYNHVLKQGSQPAKDEEEKAREKKNPISFFPSIFSKFFLNFYLFLIKEKGIPDIEAGARFLVWILNQYYPVNISILPRGFFSFSPKTWRHYIQYMPVVIWRGEERWERLIWAEWGISQVSARRIPRRGLFSVTFSSPKTPSHSFHLPPNSYKNVLANLQTACSVKKYGLNMLGSASSTLTRPHPSKSLHILAP